MINIAETVPNLELPDLSEVFAKELDIALKKLQYFKGENFDSYMDTGYVMVYFGLKMCIEYQNKGNGKVPLNIVNDIWNQVQKASVEVFEYCEIELFNKAVKEIFYNKIGEKNIVQETEEFYIKYNI